MGRVLGAAQAPPAELDGIAFLFVISLVGTALILPAFALEAWHSPPRWPGPKGVAAVLYLGLAASVAAFICWNRGVAVVGANAAASPPPAAAFGTLLALVFLGESFHLFHAAGIATILAGVVRRHLDVTGASRLAAPGFRQERLTKLRRWPPWTPNRKSAARRTALLPPERHGSEAGAEPAPRFRRSLRERARGGPVPLRRLEEQALLRRHAQRDRLQGREDRGSGQGHTRELRRQAHHDSRQSLDLRPCGVLHRRAESVFRMREEPWIDPDGAAVEKIVDVIRKCPSARSATRSTASKPSPGSARR